VDANTTAAMEVSPHFGAFVAAHSHLMPYRTEWMIFDEDVRLAGSIDFVSENEDGTLTIYDWKRSKNIKKTNAFGGFALTYCIAHLPDTNYWHYALQLNTYKAILERKYGKTVKQMFLVGLHPDLPKYQVYTVPNLANEMTELFALRKAQLTN
jgi:ATP-dependent exoDNAse (exonuclease V) beta subunit